MANIFPTQKLRAIAGQISTDEVLPKIEIINTWLTDYRTGSLKTDKETSREQAFNQDFFIKILGYEEKPHSPYSFEPKATTSGGQLPDAIVGYLHTDETRENQKVSAVVELKGAAIVLDKPQRREGNMSPVQQGFKYKTQYKHCPFVIVSNFWEFRLYQDNQLDYELWTLEDLANPRDDYINFKTFYYLLQHDNFVPKNGEGKSKTEELLSDIRIEQEDISKKFYKVYKDARLELLRNMYKNNKLVRDDIDLGVEKAQKIIDRIVFACFSEDRGLLPDNTMQRVLKVNESAYGSLWSTLKGFFNAIDVGSDKLEIPRGYNGGLFRNDAELNELIIDDEPLHVVAELSRYDFNEDLSVQILGHIFEQSISDLEEIKQKAETIVEEADKPKVSKRKKDGIFYTPDYIVKYIVENSLGEYLREAEEKCKKEAGLKGDINDKSYAKREHQAYSAYQLILQKVTVCDPACGSGAFLVQVFDFLLAENKRVAAILDGDKVSLFNTDAAIKSILQNNIYGVDLNNESVEITRLSLWLKSAAKGKKLTTLDGNIKCGNSLIDDPEVAGDKAFNWHIEFPDIFADGGFDVVVGNPPYVNFANLPVEEREYYKNSFSVYKNKTDLYAFFVERSTSILRAKGSLGYIFPHTWTTTTSFQPLRELIINNYKIQSLVDLGHGIFTDAVVKTVILVLRKGVFDGIPIFNSEFVKQVVIPRKVIELSDDYSINMDWSEVNQKLNNKLEGQSVKLLELIKFTRGIKTSDDSRFLSFEKNGSEYQKVVRGRDVKAYRIDYSGEHIWYRPDLMKEKVGSLPHEAKIFEFSEKIITQRVNSSGQLLATYDSSGYYCLDTTNISVLYNNENYNLKYILSLINSSTINWWFNDRFRMPTISGYELNQIPIKPLDISGQFSFVKKADEMLRFNKDLYENNSRFQKLVMNEFEIEKWPRSLKTWWQLDFSDFVKALKLKLSLAQKDELLSLYEKYQPELAKLQQTIDQTDNQINQMVYKLYDLTPEEIKIVETS